MSADLRNGANRSRRWQRGTQVLEDELIVVGLGRVEQRDRVTSLQRLAAVLAYQLAVHIRAVAAQVVQVDVPVFVRAAADLAVLAAAHAGRPGSKQGSGRTPREESGSQRRRALSNTCHIVGAARLIRASALIGAVLLKAPFPSAKALCLSSMTPMSLCGGSGIRRDHGGAGASAPGPCLPSTLLLPPSPCFAASILLSSAIWSFCAGAA